MSYYTDIYDRNLKKHMFRDWKKYWSVHDTYLRECDATVTDRYPDDFALAAEMAAEAAARAAAVAEAGGELVAVDGSEVDYRPRRGGPRVPKCTRKMRTERYLLTTGCQARYKVYPHPDAAAEEVRYAVEMAAYQKALKEYESLPPEDQVDDIPMDDELGDLDDAPEPSFGEPGYKEFMAAKRAREKAKQAARDAKKPRKPVLPKLYLTTLGLAVKRLRRLQAAFRASYFRAEFRDDKVRASSAPI
jgi:hypothetical protein